MKTIKYMFIIVVVTAATGLARTGMGAEAMEQTVVKGNNEFALELYAELRTEEGNLFFSPYSISTALAMAYAGAKGQTEMQMAEVLHFPTVAVPAGGDPNEGAMCSINRMWTQQRFHSEFGKIIKDLNIRGEKGGYELSVANALWGQKGYGFLREFPELIETSYGGQLTELDFAGATEAARKTINAWVESQTKNKIKDLIQRGVLNSMTRLVLTNAIYFKGNWARQFKEENTTDAPFTLAGGEKIDVPMMNQTGQFPYMQTESFQALEMPYVDNELSMIIFLPKQGDGLADFEQSLTAENLSKWLAELRKRKVIVSVPKFRMTRRFSLANVLKSMGMTDAFAPAAADFSGMNGRRDLFISAVVHKAYVDVNEEGTEAAAATGVAIGITAVRQIPVFRADHPFVFLIRDNHSGSILFIGRTMNPKPS